MLFVKSQLVSKIAKHDGVHFVVQAPGNPKDEYWVIWLLFMVIIGIDGIVSIIIK